MTEKIKMQEATHGVTFGCVVDVELVAIVVFAPGVDEGCMGYYKG